MMRCIGFVLLAGCATTVPSPGAPRPPADLSPLERSFGEKPNDKAVNLRLGEEAEMGGDLLRAQQYYLRAEALGIPESEIMPRLMRVLTEAGHYDEALERCRRRLARAPNDRATRFVAAALLVAIERPRDAERELDALQRTRSDDPQVYLALGKLYRDCYRDRQRARANFERFLALRPTDPSADEVRYELAQDSADETAPEEIRSIKPAP